MVHIFNEGNDEVKDWRVWTDCNDDLEKTGRCIGMAASKIEAITEAFQELQGDLEMLRRLGREEFGNPTNQCESQSTKNPSPA